jgi:hypothetical protein
MTRKFLIAFATVALLGAPLVPTAFAGDDNRGRDHGYDRNRDWGRRDRDHDHDHDRPRGARYVIRYELDGDRARRVAKDFDQAVRMVDFLRSAGVDARAEGRVVYYRLRGERREYRRYHKDAHEFAGRLQNYGIRARVEHD